MKVTLQKGLKCNFIHFVKSETKLNSNEYYFQALGAEVQEGVSPPINLRKQVWRLMCNLQVTQDRMLESF